MPVISTRNATARRPSMGRTPTATGRCVVNAHALRSGLGGEENDLNPTGRQVADTVAESRRRTGAETDGGHLAAAEPSERADRMLRDEIFPHRLGLLLSQSLGQLLVARLV